MKNNPQGWALFALALPAVVVGWLWMLLLLLFFVAEWKSLRFQGAGVLTARTRKRAAKFWGYSTTVGRAVLYHPVAYDETPEIDNRIEAHEFVHIKQWEDAMAASFFGGLIAAAIGWTWLHMDSQQGFAMWTVIWCLGVVAMVPGYATAVMRYGWKGIYRDCEIERSAYGQTDIIRILREDGNWSYASWEELRDVAREQQKGLLR